ncbi:hypothetical protein P5G62_024355 [Neobacillus sp. 179-C4.2 HS]|uniref:MerR family transcriptional regulator n=1 Tax=Neobacillus driksii TaxID=3035913 RepID=A0ABV4Z0R7_9BACI|nr:hypothetical protein [Neobacillus sp. 179.-C4.2 HS]MDP5197398.1 hypothetical protein [Neobacillus sp. 179.-C4.2 HS]
MIADLLTTLEDEKDQWIFQAIDRFNERFLIFGDQKDGTAESQVTEMKNSEQSMFKERSLDLERMEIELKTLVEGLAADERTIENLELTCDVLQKELAIYEDEEKVLDQIQLEMFECILDDKFTFDRKDQVVFKERKVSRLLESYNLVEMEMVDFYQRQLSRIWVLMSRSMQNIDSTAKFDFKTDPPLIELSLKHGRGLDHYLKSGNFEEDYRIVLDTLVRNNESVYDYYVSQVEQFKDNGKAEILGLWERKNDLKKLAAETLSDLQEKKAQREARILELQDQLGRAKSEWEQNRLRPKVLEDMLKEEFVKLVSNWQEKLFAESASDEERWVYHQYCQIILKQAERIIGYEYV